MTLHDVWSPMKERGLQRIPVVDQDRRPIGILYAQDAPLSVLHGAPLRLCCENELGVKLVKWVQAIEFVADFAHLGAGNGGYNEDHEFYGYRMPI